MSTYLKQSRKIVVCVGLFVSAFSFYAPPQANAQSTAATCVVSPFIAQWISKKFSELFGSGTDVPVGDTDIHSKAFTLDRLATCAAKEILHQMTASVVDWINSGFKDRSPAFLTNPSKFFLRTADDLTGMFLSQDGPLQKMCSPWSAEIRLSLALQQARTSGNGVDANGRYLCTLSRVIENARNTTVSVNGTRVGYMEDFLAGDFSQGGWAAFMALTTDDRNQPFSLYLNALDDKQQVIGDSKATLSSQLNQGHGFLTWSECKALTDSDRAQAESTTGNLAELSPDVLDTMGISRDTDGAYEKCVDKTPGSVIAAVLYPQLNTGRDELQLADNINSVVNALMNQLINQVLTKGLASLSSSGSGTANASGGTVSPYLQQIINDTSKPPANSANTPNIPTITSTYNQALKLITDSRDKYLTVRRCFTNRLNDGTLPTTGTTLSNNKINEIDRLLEVEVYPLITSLTTSLLLAPNGSISLTTAQQDLSNATLQSGVNTQNVAAFQAACDALPQPQS